MTKSGIHYPDKVLLLYWNLCPIDAFRASKDLVNEVLATNYTLLDSALADSKQGIDEAWYKVRKIWDSTQSLFARNFGHREWIDIDIDTPENPQENSCAEALDSIKTYLYGKTGRGHCMFVKTGGGVHILVRKSTVRFDPKEIITVIIAAFKERNLTFKEVCRNDNLMIPLPGTLAYGKTPVRILNKEDFTEEQALHQD